MTAQEVLNQYMTFLWEQFQYDWGWMSNPWILYTIIPECLYIFFFFVQVDDLTRTSYIASHDCCLARKTIKKK